MKRLFYLVCLLLLLAVFFSPAAAQDPRLILIQDQTGTLDQDAVRQSGIPLLKRGAIVGILLNDLPEDTTFDDALRRIGLVRNGSVDIRALIVTVNTRDQSANLIFGGNWDDQLDGQKDQLLALAEFQAGLTTGDYTSALVALLTGIETSMEAASLDVTGARTTPETTAPPRQNEETVNPVGFETFAVAGLITYGAGMGLFITPHIYRKKGLNPWLGRLVGTLAGAVGNLFLLAPLWIFSPRNKNVPYQRIKLDEIIWGMIFLSPWMISIAVFTFYPLFDSYRIALYNWRGVGEATQFVGLRHLETVASDPIFWRSFGNNLLYTIILVPIQLTLTLTLALILNRPMMRFKTFYRTIYFLPAVTSAAIVAVVIRLMLGNFGTAISALLGIDPPVDPISSPDLALPSVIAFGIWHSFGLNLVYFMAALQTVPAELYDAAKVDGANALQRLIYVTIPGIRRVGGVILFLAITGSMQVFDASFVLTKGGPYFASQVVGVYIYNYAFPSADRVGITPNLGYASAAALFMGILMLTFTVVNFVVMRRLGKSNNDSANEGSEA